MDNYIIDCDFHTHTGFSDDCDFTVEEMLEAAKAQGVKTLAVTDHYDPGYPDPEFSFTIDFDKYQHDMMAYRQKYEGIMDIRIGLEVGIMKGQFEKADKVINAFNYDFILGSFHCYEGSDLYKYDFSKVDGLTMLEGFYTYVYECLKQFSNYDVVGHFTIPDRYIGKLYDYKHVEDVIDESLKIIISQGKGLEINTSSFKYGTETWLPRESVLRRYLQLGGEILTFGSDSHTPNHYRDHFNDAAQFAKHLGFKYYCKFKDRTPEFRKL